MDSELDTLETRMHTLAVRDPCDSFLGFGWPATDGNHNKAKWAYHNWDELVTRFVLIPDHRGIEDISGGVQVQVMDPVTGTRETRYVIESFAEFILTSFHRAEKKRNRALERFTEKGYKPAHDNDDTIEGQKDTKRVWGYKRGPRR